MIGGRYVIYHPQILISRNTTAMFMSWTLYRLAKHNHVQTQLQEEIDAILGSCEVPTDEMLERLPVLDKVLNEVLRLHPTVSFVERVATRDDQLPDGTLIKAGDVVVSNVYSMQRWPAYWGRFAADFIPNRHESF